MTSAIVNPPPSCLGSVYLSRDGTVDGWCVYPDRPDDRATVELIVDGRVVRAMRATRLRLDRRDLGMGDGYCGFSFPVKSTIEADHDRVILEVREKRLGLLIGRILVGQNNVAMKRRLDAAISKFESVDSALDRRNESSALEDFTKDLGLTLLSLAGQASGERKLARPGLHASMEKISDIPAMTLGWSPCPRFSLIIWANNNLADLAGRIRSIAVGLNGLEAEFLLLDDGTSPLAVLLPTRLRHLALVRISPSDNPATALNAAAAAARGDFLAFARRTGPRPADLRNALERAKIGRLDVSADGPHQMSGTGPELALHGLQCIVARDDFNALGGFDAAHSEQDMWATLVAKAQALNLNINGWAALRPGSLQVE